MILRDDRFELKRTVKKYLLRGPFWKGRGDRKATLSCSFFALYH